MRERTNYESFQHSTVLAVADKMLADLGVIVRGIYVRKLNITAEVQIKLGRNGQLITLRQGGGIEAPLPGPPLSSGVFLTAAAGGAGAFAELCLAFEDEEHGARGPAFFIVNV